jgi:hypothetical protein
MPMVLVVGANSQLVLRTSAIVYGGTYLSRAMFFKALSTFSASFVR